MHINRFKNTPTVITKSPQIPFYCTAPKCSCDISLPFSAMIWYGNTPIFEVHKTSRLVRYALLGSPGLSTVMIAARHAFLHFFALFNTSNIHQITTPLQSTTTSIIMVISATTNDVMLSTHITSLICRLPRNMHNCGQNWPLTTHHNAACFHSSQPPQSNTWSGH